MTTFDCLIAFGPFLAVVFLMLVGFTIAHATENFEEK